MSNDAHKIDDACTITLKTAQSMNSLISTDLPSTTRNVATIVDFLSCVYCNKLTDEAFDGLSLILGMAAQTLKVGAALEDGKPIED